MTEPLRLTDELPEGFARTLLEANRRDLAPVSVRRNVLSAVNTALVGGVAAASLSTISTTGVAGTGSAGGSAAAGGLSTSGLSTGGLSTSGVSTGGIAATSATTGAVGTGGAITTTSTATGQGLFGKLVLGVAQKALATKLGAAVIVKAGVGLAALGGTVYAGSAILEQRIEEQRGAKQRLAAESGDDLAKDDGLAPGAPTGDESATRNGRKRHEETRDGETSTTPAMPGLDSNRQGTNQKLDSAKPTQRDPLGSINVRGSERVAAADEAHRRDFPQSSIKSPGRAPPSELGRELAALSAARSELSQGHGARALALLDLYTKNFPDGALAPEALGLRERAKQLSRVKNEQ